jgi:hypothetical protein
MSESESSDSGRGKIRTTVTEISGGALGVSGEEYVAICDLRHFVKQFVAEPTEERLRRVRLTCSHLEVLIRLRQGLDADE